MTAARIKEDQDDRKAAPAAQWRGRVEAADWTTIGAELNAAKRISTRGGGARARRQFGGAIGGARSYAATVTVATWLVAGGTGSPASPRPLSQGPKADRPGATQSFGSCCTSAVVDLPASTVKHFRSSARPAGFEPATRCLEGTSEGSRDVAWRRSTSHLAAAFVAGCRRTLREVCLHWLPYWLPKN
jgi:hypothetical protein